MSTKEHDKSHRPRRSRNPRTNVFSRIRRERSKSPIRRKRSRSPRQRTKEGGVFKRLESRGKSVSTHSDSSNEHSHSRYTQALSESRDSGRNARVWFDDLPPESIDSYDDLKKHSWKIISNKRKARKQGCQGALECIRISEFMHEITDTKLIKRLHEKIPKTVDEMIRVTTSFPRGEMTASNHERKKTFPLWKQYESIQKQNFKKGGFQNQQGSKRKQDRFSLLTKIPKEIFALDKGIIKALPPMTTLVEKQNHAKFCEFHGEVGHNTDESHEMLKILVKGGVITLKSSKLVPLECAMVSGPTETPSATKAIAEERVKAAINHEYPEQTVMIGSTLTEGEDEIVRDIEETFKTLRENNMKLNPKKCAFEVEEGMFLGYKVNAKGLKVCPDKVDAVLSLPSSKCLKDVQKLNGKLTSLNRFLAKSAEKSLPFFKTLKKCTKKSDFHWTTEAEKALVCV
nr:reverse transcriptase domain-containing protein [Tanacetum cinerariifolium]